LFAEPERNTAGLESISNCGDARNPPRDIVAARRFRIIGDGDDQLNRSTPTSTSCLPSRVRIFPRKTVPLLLTPSMCELSSSHAGATKTLTCPPGVNWIVQTSEASCVHAHVSNNLISRIRAS